MVLLRQQHLVRAAVASQSRRVRRGKPFSARSPGAAPAPTLDGLLAFHRTANDSGDEVALEWSRRQLEGFRNRVFNDDDLRRIDLATDRPDRVNPRLIDVYVEAMKERSSDELETFADKAVDNGDANACIAAFVLARQAPDGPRVRWVRKILSALPDFPDAALTTLRGLEAEARASEAEAARAQAQFAIARAEAEVGLDGLEAPTARDLERLARIESRPVARPGEAIGLALERRGAIDESEFRSLSLKLDA